MPRLLRLASVLTLAQAVSLTQIVPRSLRDAAASLITRLSFAFDELLRLTSMQQISSKILRAASSDTFSCSMIILMYIIFSSSAGLVDVVILLH